MNVLPSKFFDLSNTKKTNDFEYQGYVATHTRSTMVLFSEKTGTPLAALILGTPDRGVLSVLTARPSMANATEPYFQGMFNMSDQVVSLSIVNLNDKGMINFNILHTPHRVSEVDPGPSYGINKVNELHENQSYTIPADQRNDRQIILSGKTKTSITGEKVKVTVAESETKENKEGVYFYLSVVAANSCPELVEKFAEGTSWKCVDSFVRKVKANVLYTKGFRSLGGPESMFSRILGTQRSHNDGPFPDPNPHQEGKQISINEDDMYIESIDQYLENYTDETLDGSPPPPTTPVRTSAHFNHVDIGNTQTGEISYGKQVEETGGFTGEEYAYEYPSTPTVLCLSICPELKFFPLPDLDSEVTNQVKDFAENEGKLLLNSLKKVYKSEYCVIDLESEADTVILTCGHQCVFRKNVEQLPKPAKCPLCRGHVTALVRAFT